MSENQTEVEVSQDIPAMVPIEDLITEPTTGALQRLEAQAASMETALKIAKGLSATEMVPEHFQRGFKPRGCTDPLGDRATWNLTAAILYGAELGLTAVQSAQNVFVVHGKPAVYARTMAAQVRRAGYRIEEVEASDTKVIWRGLRDGHWASSEWTMERATQAGYTTNERYLTNPQEMLRAKAIAETCRIQYQDVLLGMAYTVEELQLENVTVTRPVREGVRGTAKLRQIAEAAAQDQAAAEEDEGRSSGEDSSPPVPPEEPSQPTGTTVVDPESLVASQEQVDRIKALGKAKGMTMTVLLEEVTVFLQRDKRLPDLHKLSSAEADEVITNMTSAEEPEQGTLDT